MGATLQFGILGPLELRLDGGEALALGGRRQRALLVALLLSSNEVVSTDHLIDQLWGEHPPASAVHTVQVFVSRLRRLLGVAGSRLETQPPGYVLRVEAGELDADRCQQLYESARIALTGGDPARAARLLRQTESLWRGPPLADFAYESFAQAAIARLEELRVSCREELIDAQLALGDHVAVVPTLEALVREHPLRERPRGQLMLALYRAGRQADALDVFQKARRQLVEDLAVEPSIALRELEQAILRQDPALQGPPASPPAEPSPDDRGEPAEQTRREPVTPTTAARKTLTALALEVTVRSHTGGDLDPEVRAAVLEHCLSAAGEVVRRHGGVIDSWMRGSWVAVFGIPRLHEDDALRAARAALEIRDEIPRVAGESGAELVLGTGLSTGLVVTDGQNGLPAGEPIDVAARLAHAAPPGEILMSPATLQLVRHAVEVGPHTASDPRAGQAAAEPGEPVRLLDIHPRTPGLARRLDSALVDREQELGRLREAWRQVREQSSCHLFTLVGPAGVGKSRLVAELMTAAGGATALSGRCLPYGEGITFWPMIEALGAVGERAQAVRDRLRRGGSATAEELFWEVRGLLETLAAERPLILHVDDLQWAESMLLDLIEHIVDLSRHAPILVVCTARLELYEQRPVWGGGKLNASAVLLEPLPRQYCEMLAGQLGSGLYAEVRARLVTASEGNPLFLEEMIAFARERGVVAVPPTIQALLAARVENLPDPERQLLQCAAVVGEHFDRDAARELTGELSGRDADAVLGALVRKDLIRPMPEAPVAHAYRFRHLLIRDAAYDALPKTTRAHLHARFAQWTEATTAELLERDEITGWHMEQTVRYLRELGQTPDQALELRGAAHLHTAGLRARERNDPGAARSLLERAHHLAAADPGLRVRVGLDLAEQLIDAGELQRADGLLREAEEASDATGRAALLRFEWLVRVQPEGAIETFRVKLPQIQDQLARSGDERGLAMAHLAAREVEVMVSRATEAAEEARLAAEHAQKTDDQGLYCRALGLYVTSIMYGRQDARAIARELAAIPAAEPGSFLAARLDLSRAELARLEGRFADARASYACAIDGFRALGMPEDEAACEADLARAELSAGDPRAALAALERSDALLAGLGERSRRSTTKAHMAQAHALLGSLDDARAAVDQAEQLGAAEDVLNFTVTHQVRAWLALADGDGDGARRWAHSAVDYALQTDYLAFQGNSTMGLARVEAALGHATEATRWAEAAHELFARKGDRPGMQQARALLDELDRTPA